MVFDSTVTSRSERCAMDVQRSLQATMLHFLVAFQDKRHMADCTFTQLRSYPRRCHVGRTALDGIPGDAHSATLAGDDDFLVRRCRRHAHSHPPTPTPTQTSGLSFATLSESFHDIEVSSAAHLRPQFTLVSKCVMFTSLPV